MFYFAIIRQLHLVLLCSVLLSTNTSAFGQSQIHESNEPNASSEVGVHLYGRTNKACLLWTDGCVNCSRGGAGETYSCSNIGIACQPKGVECVKRADEKTN
jgi:hypothetical protein